MNNLSISRHAIARSAQRGIAINDLNILMLIGCEVENGYFVRDKDYESFEREVFKSLERIRRQCGARLVVSDGCIVTTYRTNRRQGRRLLRNAEETEVEE